MRIIGGTAGGQKLKTLPGMQTRPTSDKVKAAIFNMLQSYVIEANVLDLYAGSGALAIEAISRGAKQACCVDKNPQAVRIIRENIQRLDHPKQVHMMQQDAFKALFDLKQQKTTWDLVFLDPPYAKQKLVELLEKLAEYQLLLEGAFVVCELDKRDFIPDDLFGYELYRHKYYGNTQIKIYRWAGVDQDE